MHNQVQKYIFFGMIYSENGISPDPEKINDQKNIPPPTCKKKLQEFIVALTYLLPFIPNLANKTTFWEAY